jgi:hypothetical protein
MESNRHTESTAPGLPAGDPAAVSGRAIVRAAEVLTQMMSLADDFAAGVGFLLVVDFAHRRFAHLKDSGRGATGTCHPVIQSASVPPCACGGRCACRGGRVGRGACNE